ncbi:tetratricopeptide repeat protein, partial [Streptomyces sp. NPDC020875]|uniref:tetratricopeptide repeat protein n=1 Tax=Streptomyces sp. NPDC020875 TaxID=3154898 RepID=UPI0033D5CC10
MRGVGGLVDVAARTVVVRSGEGSQGTGFVLGKRLVLTAAHVLKNPGAVSVQVPHRAGRVGCRVVWARFEDEPRGVWDAALLLADDDLLPDGVPAVRWGRLATSLPCRAEAWGYPVAGRTADEAVSMVHRIGQVHPDSGSDRDRYVIHGPAGPETCEDGSPWKGMSGAALWCGSSKDGLLLTGVVVGDAPGWSHTHLEALPAYALTSDPDFRALVEQHTGRTPVLEPADLQHVTDRNARPRPARSPADLLRPEQATVTFMGRDALLGELADWCAPGDQGGPGQQEAGAAGDVWGWGAGHVRARLLTGAGGAGKTRLAAELASRMAVGGWTVVRLTPDTTAPLDALARVTRPLLVVVDYAETRVPQLHTLLQVVDHEQTARPVRILCLARGAGDWWTRAADHPHAQALADATVTAIPALHHSPDERADSYRRALEDFAARLPQTGPDHRTGLVDSLTMPAAFPALTGDEFDHPLSVHMAALLALLDKAAGATPAPVGARSLEGRLLGHERTYWDNTANSTGRNLGDGRTGGETRELAIALAALTVPADRDQARHLLAHLPGLGDESAAGLRGALATWLADLYPAPDGAAWGSLQPDRLAEHHIHTQTAREPDLFTRILANLPTGQTPHTLSVLARTAQRPHHTTTITNLLQNALTTNPEALAPAVLDTATRTPHPQPLVTALTHLLHTTPDTGLLHQLRDKLPDSSLALAEWAADLTTALVHHHDTPDPDLPDLAASLNNQSLRLADLGRREEALAAVTRAVTIREALAGARPDAFLPDLAASLNNQSVQLGALGRLEEALTTITRATGIYETLAGARPDAFLPDLAASLNNQSVQLGDLGRLEEALAAVTRATGIYEALAGARPDAFLPGLAMSFNNQSLRLGDLGRLEEALAAVTRATGIYEALAGARPDA